MTIISPTTGFAASISDSAVRVSVFAARWLTVECRSALKRYPRRRQEFDSLMRFNCDKCPGYCCSHPRIAVSDFDIARLAKHFGISEADARKRFTYRYTFQDTVDEQVLRHQKDSIYKSVCKLFDRDTRKCSAYEARPNVCRKYPYGNNCGYYSFLKFERDFQDDPEFVPS